MPVNFVNKQRCLLDWNPRQTLLYVKNENLVVLASLCRLCKVLIGFLDGFNNTRKVNDNCCATIPDYYCRNLHNRLDQRCCKPEPWKRG
ncbi:hypothetical protein RB195_026163 [Necator americanus]|uniref:Uncharacterized protein n=1 Tax=Necator americanus TaxID=51031 RepID=A0ABR1EVN3_NECAM